MPSPMMTIKGLAALLYEMGRTFDNLNSTRMATEDFLRTGNPKVIGSRNDLALLEDLRDASSFVVHYDYAAHPFDMSYVKAVNARLRRTAAIEPGVLRRSENVVVGCAGGVIYVPPVPDEAALERAMTDARGSSGGLEDAALLFARLAKAQPFGDGNKRTALQAANGLILRSGGAVMLSVPVEPDETARFNELLSAWYLRSDDTVVAWLAQWNRQRQSSLTASLRPH